MASKNTIDMTQGPVAKKLFAFAIPVMLTLMMQQLYNMADKMIVGQFAENGELALAAIGTTSSATALLLNLCTGLAVGANVHCAFLRGAGRTEDLQTAMHTTVTLGAVLGAVLSIVGLILSKPLLLMMDTPEKVLDLSTLYLRIYAAGLPATVLYNFCAGILRSHGDTKRPMYILAVSGIINVVLNIFFVVVLKMSVAGVAIATIIAQVYAVIRILGILFNPKGDYRLSAKKLRITKEPAVIITKQGVPIGFNGIVFSLSNIIIQTSMNSFNDTALLAAKAAALDVTHMLYQVVAAFAQAATSFSAQCHGARNHKRIGKLARSAALSSGSIVLACALLFIIFAEQVIGLFNSSPDVVAYGRTILAPVGLGYFLFSVSDVFLGCSRGMGKATSVTLANVLGICLPRLIWVWFIFPIYPSVLWLNICYPISYGISLIMQMILFLKTYKKELAKNAFVEA